MKQSLLAILLGFACAVNAQVDKELNSLTLQQRPHFGDTSFQSARVRKGDIDDDDPMIILFKPLYIQKYQGAWMYDADSCSIKRIKARKMAYFSTGTQAIYCGLSWDAGVKNRKSLRAVSYPVLEELKEGDTLRFEITTLADADAEFQPEIYTSEKIKVKQEKLKNGNYLVHHGPLPIASVSDTQLVHNTILIPITKDLEGTKWVHVVNNEDAQQRGFIIESDYHLGGTMDDEYVRVFYRNDSYKLSSKAQELIDSIIGHLQSNNAIVLRGYADPSGAKDYNIKLAEKRAKSVMNYMVDHGVDPNRVKIEEFDILYNKRAKDSRVCTILVL